MGKRQREWARKTRDALFDVLGYKCKKCGITEELEFDVIIPVGNNDHHRKMEWSWRMSFYRKQYEHGNLQVLCRFHNAKKQNSMELWTQPPIDEPF